MRSLKAGLSWSYQDLKFEGLSLSGIRTSIAMPQFDICFDVAQGLPFAIKQKKFFITHGHLDHCAGVPYILSQKALANEAPPTFYMPPSLIEPLTKIMRLWEQVEGHQYKINFQPADIKSDIDLNPQYFIRPFTTIHRIESFGYTLFHRARKLKPEFHKLSQEELKTKGTNGVILSDIQNIPLVSFTGDTQIEFLNHSTDVRNSKILILECTYLDNKKSVEHAKKWGHTHLDELIPRLDEIKSEKIVIIHLSSRYTVEDAQNILKNRIPREHQERVVLFPAQ